MACDRTRKNVVGILTHDEDDVAARHVGFAPGVRCVRGDLGRNISESASRAPSAPCSRRGVPPEIMRENRHHM